VALWLTPGLSWQALKPDLLINAGTAGGFRAKGGQIGDVYVSSLLRNHDRRLILPQFVDYGIHKHEALPTPHLRDVRAAAPTLVNPACSLEAARRSCSSVSSGELSWTVC
jgi:5'-methylthioadenosine nucleosidase